MCHSLLPARRALRAEDGTRPVRYKNSNVQVSNVLELSYPTGRRRCACRSILALEDLHAHRAALAPRYFGIVIQVGPADVVALLFTETLFAWVLGVAVRERRTGDR